MWAALRDLGSHVEWMADAVAIRFVSGQRTGVGTTFDCDTRIGPFRTVDRMEVVEWREGRAIGVRHTGLVRGEGRFTLRSSWARPGTTVFAWRERLSFPWWLGGRVAGWVASPVLAAVWRRNLRRFRSLVESGRSSPRPGA